MRDHRASRKDRVSEQLAPSERALIEAFADHLRLERHLSAHTVAAYRRDLTQLGVFLERDRSSLLRGDLPAAPAVPRPTAHARLRTGLDRAACRRDPHLLPMGRRGRSPARRHLAAAGAPEGGEPAADRPAAEGGGGAGRDATGPWGGPHARGAGGGPARSRGPRAAVRLRAPRRGGGRRSPSSGSTSIADACSSSARDRRSARSRCPTTRRARWGNTCVSAGR